MTTRDVGSTESDPMVRRASRASLLSLLNLTFLPGAAFVWLILMLRKSKPGDLDHYHARLGTGINLFAAFALIVLSGLMILLGGFDSAWTWVYVITYFTFVHSIFIVTAVWAMVRSWNGQRLTRDGQF